MIIPVADIYLVMLIFIRAAALFTAIPPIGGTSVPRVIRLAVAGFISYLIAPYVPQPSALPTHFVGYFLACGMEMATGLLMGFGVYCVFAAVSAAGHIVGMEIGLQRSSAVNPISDEAGGGAIGSLLYYLAALVLLTLNLHHEIFKAFVSSFSIIQPGGFPLKYSILEMIRCSKDIFVVGFLIGAPFIAINFIINLTFALLGKIAPKMNVFMVSFAVRILAGLAILSTTGILIAHYIQRELWGLPEDMIRMLVGS